MREAYPVSLDGVIFAPGVDVLCDGQRVEERAAMIGWIRRDSRGQHDDRRERGDQEHDHHRGEGKGKKGMSGKEGKVIVEQLFPWNIALISVHIFMENSNELNPLIGTFRVCEREYRSSGSARLPLFSSK